MLDIMHEAPRARIWRENLRTLRVATWLGWQVESNWADPIAFAIMSILRPMASALIVVVMYQVVAGGARDSFFTYLFVSNAFFVLVVQTMSGMAWAIFDDRENYRMLKYIYTSPARKFAYLLGRAAAKMLLGVLTSVILLTTGALFLGLPFQFERIAWGWLAVYAALGFVILCALGIVLAGVALVIARHGESIGDVTAGMLLLFSGAYFPPDILPAGLREISLALPVTYWLEGMRRALAGGVLAVDGRPVSPLLARWDNPQLLGILALSAAVSAAASFLFYRWVEHAAKERGMIDIITDS
jgi:ABC-2 type transport system permease protein